MTTKVANIIKAYANDLKGIIYQKCRDEEFSVHQCGVLDEALETDARGIITPEEKIALEQAGFAKDFIQDIAGIDGKKALQARVRWLGDHINTKWYRPDYSRDERTTMVKELGEIGPDAKGATLALTLAFKDEYQDLNFYAAVALGNIGKEAIPALIDVLKDKDNHVHLYATEALGNIGKEAVPALIDALKDERWYVRHSAIRALNKIGKQAFFAIPVLEKMAANDPINVCRITAKKTLDNMMEEIR